MEIGLIGCGFMAGEHLKNLRQMEDCTVTSVSDVNPEAIRNLKTHFPSIERAREFADYQEMIRAGGLDCVIIVTPHSLHCDQAIFALENNLDVLIEKPMVTSPSEAKKIADLARNSGRLVIVAYQRHTEPAYWHAKQLITDGNLGNIHYISGLQTQGWYRDKLGTWRTNPVYNEMGYIADSGSHLIDAIQWICGHRAEEVFAWIDNLSSDVPVNAGATIRFEGNIIANVSLVGSAPEWREHIRLYGDKGEIVLNFNYDEYYIALNTSVEIIDYYNSKIERPLRILPPRSNPTQNFVNSLRGKEEPLCTAEDGLKTAEILDAIQTSSKLGKPVRLSADA
jgi:predicted dehydrogenase